MSNGAADTIFAVSSGRGPAAIAVVRICGPRSRTALAALIGRVPEPRHATLAQVRNPATGETIDQSLALWFPGPASETGEDMAELQVHGGRAVIAAVLGALGGLDGFRLAEPGEFTRRAFENGRIDLTQVEALGDLIAAETEAQRRQALGQLRGLLGGRAEDWRERLIAALALVEAGIDFCDEADVPNTVMPQAQGIVAAVAQEIAQALKAADRGERLRDGLRVVIAGAPNAGKSTLLNRLARREAAIVSPYAGTTRDLIEVHLDLGGYPVSLIDTAGIADTCVDPVEREGIRRARESAARADLVLWVVDAAAPGPLAAREHAAAAAVDWTVINKTDLVAAGAVARLATAAPGRAVHRVSAATGAGVDDLVQAISGFAADQFSLEPALITRERQRLRLKETLAALAGAAGIGAGEGEELVADELRRALTNLGRLTGRVDVEEILEVIFRDFCIGK